MTLLALAAGFTVLSVAPALAGARRDLLAAGAALETARSELAAHDVAGSRDALERAEGFLDAAADRSRPAPMRLLRPVPLIGSPVRALAAATRAGQELVAAGRILSEAADSFPTSGAVGVDGHDLGPFHDAARRSAEAVAAAGEHLASARRALEPATGATLSQVSGPARSLLGTVDGARARLASARRGLRLLSDLTGPEADARLLFLAQDSMELRATGGFIGSYGVLAFAGGTVKLERYDDFDALPAPEPPMEAPDELRGKLSYWDLSNSNWWPHFPTSARTAVEMFRRQGGGEVAGVVASTEHVMARLVGAVGPITLPGYPEPVTEEGFARRVVHEVELKRPLDVPRKKFLIELAHEVFGRLFSLAPDRFPAVTRALAAGAGTGDLQVWFANPEWQAAVAGTSLEGALPGPGGDVLSLVDTNMTASKANADLVRRAHYRVRRDPDGRLLATLEIDYHNQGDGAPPNPYYHGFLRLYVPEASELLSDGQSASTEVTPQGRYTVFAQQVFVRPGEHQIVTFRYRLPEDVAPGGRYRLTWLRQAGTPADVLRVTIGNRTRQADPAQRRFSLSADLGA